jgi:hypothetical protein
VVIGFVMHVTINSLDYVGLAAGVIAVIAGIAGLVMAV